jgi:enterochelin esterase-like enzyme
VIVVLPDSKTVHNGSMYSSSQTTGDFEAFVSRDLVAYVDQHYRTLARRESRGLVGHSMGGYGASRIGMRHADVFGALYMMSPCCLSPRDPAQFAGAATALADVKTLQDATKLPWGLRAALASAAAWSPNPKKPPLYLDLPVENGVVRPDVAAKWAANAPLAFIDQYVGALRRYKSIAMDVGDRDGLRDDATRLHEAMDRYGLANSFEIYPGDHTSDVPTRFQDHVLPFFSRNLTFEKH